MCQWALEAAEKYDLTQPEAHLLLILAHMADEDCRCFPETAGKKKTLPRYMRFTKRHLFRLLNDLEERHLIRRERCRDRRGYQTANSYFLVGFQRDTGVMQARRQGDTGVIHQGDNGVTQIMERPVKEQPVLRKELTVAPNGADYYGDSKKEAARRDFPGGQSENATGNPPPSGQSESGEPIVFSEGVVQLTQSRLDQYKRKYPALALTIEAAIYTIAIALPKNGGDWQGRLEARLHRANGRVDIEQQQFDIERQQLDAKRRQPKWGVNYL